jgi:hypothetical protein
MTTKQARIDRDVRGTVMVSRLFALVANQPGHRLETDRSGRSG